MRKLIRSIQLWTAMLVVATALIACNTKNNNVGDTALLTPFSSDDDYREFTRGFDFKSPIIGNDILATPSTSGENVSNFSANNSVGGFSRTNLQEKGVDEPDVVKTDGEYLYVVSDDRINIVDALPATETHKVAEIAVPGDVDNIFLHNKQLIIIYSDYTDIEPVAETDDIALGIDYFSDTVRTGVLIADISNPEMPLTQRHELYDGSINAARSVDNTLHLVLNYAPSTVSGDIDPVELLPKRYLVSISGAKTEVGAVLNTSQILHPEKPEWLNFVMIVSIDLTKSDSNPNALGYLGDSYAIYSSPQSLYIVQSDYDSINSGDITIQPVTYSTQIHKFSLQSGAVRASASGTVPGRILNQYSLSEHNGFLRLATDSWNRDTAVYVLEQVEDKLEIAGKVENIAPGETLFSARFIGDKGFLVTFLTVDPLFTIDLSNPRSPVVVGELKVPGFSTYLHPISDTHLLAIGRSPDNVQLSLFDITDFSKPLLVDKVEWEEYEWTDAMYDSLAFNYWGDRNLLGLPIYLWNRSGFNSVSGMRVYTIDAESGFSSKGQLTSARTDYQYPQRSVFIGDYSYHVTNKQIDVAATDSLGEIIASVELIAQKNIQKSD